MLGVILILLISNIKIKKEYSKEVPEEIEKTEVNEVDTMYVKLENIKKEVNPIIKEIYSIINLVIENNNSILKYREKTKDVASSQCDDILVVGESVAKTFSQAALMTESVENERLKLDSIKIANSYIIRSN